MGCGTTKNTLQAINSEAQPIPTPAPPIHCTLPPEVMIGFANILKSSITMQPPMPTHRAKNSGEGKTNAILSPGELTKTGHLITPVEGETRRLNQSEDQKPSGLLRQPTIPVGLSEAQETPAPLARLPTLPTAPMRAPTLPAQFVPDVSLPPQLSDHSSAIPVDEVIPEQPRLREMTPVDQLEGNRLERIPTMPPQENKIEEQRVLTASEGVRNKVDMWQEQGQDAMLNAYYEKPISNPFLDLMNKQEEMRAVIDSVPGCTALPEEPRQAFVAAAPEVSECC